MAIEYLGLSNINGPLVALEGVQDAFFDEIVEFVVDGNIRKMGRIVDLKEQTTCLLSTRIRSLPDIRWKCPCHRICWDVHLMESAVRSTISAR